MTRSLCFVAVSVHVSILFYVLRRDLGRGVWLRTLFAQVKLRVCIVVRLILKRYLSVFLNAFLVTGSLAVGSFLLNDELLARVGVDLCDLR